MNESKKESHDRWALITGASAGIGEAFARVFANNGFNLVLVARRKDKLENIASQLKESLNIKVEVLTADLADPSSPQKIYNTLQSKHIKPSALVNNAGYAVKTGFADTPWKAHADMLQVMMTAVTELCYLFADDMKEQQYGRIINVSSVAAFTPQMPGSLYGGVKSFVACLSEALHLEMSDFGVNCTALCPGFTRSEFHDVMEVRDATNKFPNFIWSSAEDVATQGYQSVMAGKPLCIPGRINKTITGLMNFLPKSLKFKAAKQQSIFEN